jgi:PAS domain S-box-containing protein
MDFNLPTENLICKEDYSLVLNAIFKESKDGIFVTDAIGTVVMLNKASEEMLGLEKKNVIGMNVKDLVDQGYYDKSVALLAIEKRRTVSIIQHTFSNKKILTTGIPIFNNDELKYIFINDRDITTLSSYINLLNEEEFKEKDLHLDFSQQDIIVSSIDDIVIQGQAMKKIFKKVQKAARAECPVLLTGETGVGKSVFAKLIHNLSQRKNNHFLEVNCGAINENLYESEMFGYEKGAFTGARRSGKVGIIESTNKGTLFLDEINLIPYYLQAKILKFLDNSEIRKVGSIKQTQVDTRIIAATNDDIEELIKKEEFRRDLYYRLNVIPIHIPPLRERLEELEFLIDYFVYFYCKKYNMNKKLSSDFIMSLFEYEFPGNIRELDNIMRQALIMSDHKTLTSSDLPDYILEKTEFKNSKNNIPKHIKQKKYKNYISKQELNYLKKVIAQCGSQRKAADMLGISQSTLSRKLNRISNNYVVHDS